MELSRQAVEKLATVFLNLGQGIILADLLAALLESEYRALESFLTFLVGSYTVFAGLQLVNIARDMEG